MLTGGETGAAVVKGKSADSLLVKALNYDDLEMPPTGKLPDEVIADFVKWIDMGASDPRQGAAPAKAKREIDIAEGRQWWSFQPLKAMTPPEGSAESAIDRFLVAVQTQHGLKAVLRRRRKN